VRGRRFHWRGLKARGCFTVPVCREESPSLYVDKGRSFSPPLPRDDVPHPQETVVDYEQLEDKFRESKGVLRWEGKAGEFSLHAPRHSEFHGDTTVLPQGRTQDDKGTEDFPPPSCKRHATQGHT